VRLGVGTAIVGGEVIDGDVEIADGEIVAVGLPGGGTGVAVPGLVDLQVNGYAGVDVSSGSVEELEEMARRLGRDGVLWYQPTIVTAAVDDMRAALERLARVRERSGLGARVLGAHLEGPFLSAGRAGAHEPGHIRDPSLDILRRLLDTSCPVTEMTLAPERPGAFPVIDELVRRRVVVSLGHTDADASYAAAAVDSGARAVTHLYNAMRPFWHRDPGVIGVALTRDDVVVTVIGDGLHVAPEALLMAWRAARHRLALVSDAIAAARMPDGIHRLGPTDVTVVDGVSRTWDGALAGATRSLLDGVRLLVSLGVPIAEAIAAATSTPARLLGREEIGVIRPGGPADLLVLDDDLTIRNVLRGGSFLT
jgi:N-acetylglucosamine-6-phosphate deacetylase